MPHLEYIKLTAVADITVAKLQQAGIKGLIIDVDNTIVSRATADFEASAKSWIQSLQSEDFSLTFLSNSWHKVTLNYGKILGIPIIYKAMKPFPFAFYKAIKQLELPKANIAVVGDQVYTDCLGAKIAGLKCYKVEPLSDVDLWYTKILRKFE